MIETNKKLGKLWDKVKEKDRSKYLKHLKKTKNDIKKK